MIKDFQLTALCRSHRSKRRRRDWTPTTDCRRTSRRRNTWNVNQQTVSGDGSTDGALDSYINIFIFIKIKSLTKNIKIWLPTPPYISFETQGQML